MSTNLDYASLADRRLNAKVELYDMITAVTQRGINNQFEAMYKVEPTLQKLIVKVPEDPSRVTMDVDLGPPKVALRLGTNNKTVWFYMTLKTGWFDWFNMASFRAERTQIRDWVLVFEVNLDMKQMVDGTIPPRIVEALRRNGVGQAGNYTVKQLLIDFTTAKLSNYNDKESHLPGLDASTGTVTKVASIRAMFKNYIESYLETIKLSDDGSGTTIAFVPEFTNPETFRQAPSIPPTALRFQNYPFRAQVGGQDLNSEGTLADQGNNMLLYLEMTNNRALPEQALNTSENWVVPGPDNRLIDGCVALSKKIFLDEWFIPKMIALNWLTDITATQAKYEYLWREVKERFEFNWSRSQQPNLDYSFKYEGINSNNEAVYSFYHDSEQISYGGANDMYHTLTKASVKNYVVIPLAPSNGECVIKISGYSRAELEIKAAINYLYYWGDITWNAAFKFSAVGGDGGLEVVMDPPIPNEPKVNGGKSSGFFGEVGVTGPDPKEIIKSRMSSYNVVAVLNDMNNLFKGTWQFFFAGAGEFFFKNPVFNREGDLMLELQYKGV